MNNLVFDEHKAFGLLKQLSFPRLAGTADEKKAANLLKRYLISIGLTPKEETFKVQTYREIFTSLEVLTPYHKRYNVGIVGCSGSTPGRGITGELVHVNSFAPEHLATVKHRVALMYNRLLDRTLYQKLRQQEVKALIRVIEPSVKLPASSQGDLFIKAYGKIPAVLIGYEDGLEIMHKGARKVNIIIKQKEFKATSRNLIATVEGTELPNEKILIFSHYDSVSHSPASLDNASGSVTIAEFARYFAVCPPKRTLVFIWLGGEELGLKGSYAYVKRHKKELSPPKRPILLNKTPQVKLGINVDAVGVVLGYNGAFIYGAEAMGNFAGGLAKEKGLPLITRHSVYSSDNIPFNETGIPSISLCRASSNYTHTPIDDLHLMSPDGLKIMGQFGLELVSRIANAIEIPFDLSIPESDRKSIYDYIERFDPFYKRPR